MQDLLLIFVPKIKKLSFEKRAFYAKFLVLALRSFSEAVEMGGNEPPCRRFLSRSLHT